MKAPRVILAVAGLGVAVAISACGASGSTAAVNSTAVVDTSSQSYRMGLASGTNGPAEMAAFGYDAIGNQPGQVLVKRGPVSHQEACEQGFNSDNSPFTRPDNGLNKTDYMAGCLYGLDHNANSTNASHAPAATVVPPSKKGPNGSTIPNRPGS